MLSALYCGVVTGIGGVTCENTLKAGSCPMSSFVTTEKWNLVAVACVCLVTLAPGCVCRAGRHLIAGRAVGSEGTSLGGAGREHCSFSGK